MFTGTNFHDSIRFNHQNKTYMSSSDFLFSFLLFFQVQIESIKESGFYKILSEKYPQVSQGLSQAPKMEPEIEGLLEATGLDFDDLDQARQHGGNIFTAVSCAAINRHHGCHLVW